MGVIVVVRGVLRCAVVGALAVVVLPSVARAQSSGSFLLDTISVYATRNERQLLDVPATVTVVGREEIERRMVRDADDLVRYEPGVRVDRTTSRTDPFSNLSGFTIRGVSGNRVLDVDRRHPRDRAYHRRHARFRRHVQFEGGGNHPRSGFGAVGKRCARRHRRLPDQGPRRLSERDRQALRRPGRYQLRHLRRRLGEEHHRCVAERPARHLARFDQCITPRRARAEIEEGARRRWRLRLPAQSRSDPVQRARSARSWCRRTCWAN